MVDILTSSDRADLRDRGVFAGLVRTLALAAPRSLLFAGLVAAGFLNGISEKAYNSIGEDGALGAVSATFGVSIILWAAWVVAIRMLLASRAQQPLGRRDLAVAVFASICFLVPIPALAWVGICAIGIHLRLAAPDEASRRTANIILASTIPLFWARILFAAFMDPVLRIDAHLVGWAIGTAVHDNIVSFADGSGALFIAPACSSLANLSLAVLGATLFVNLRSGRWTTASVAWCLASMVGVVFINVARLALMARHPGWYDMIHGPLGAHVAGLASLAVILLIGFHRIGHDAQRPA